MFDESLNLAKIRVVGIGGAGKNAVNSLIDAGVTGADFFVINTDKQDLIHSKAENKIQIGEEVTRGLGAGSDPELGRKAAEENIEEIRKMCEGVNLLFITAGMGGGTGTGAAPVVARVARECGCLTIAVVTKPFSFEGKKRSLNCEAGLSELRENVDMLIVIPNAKLLQAMPEKTPVVEAFKLADDYLKQGICGIVDLINTPSLINLDFADLVTVVKNQGIAHIGRGMAEGENRVIEAVRMAVSGQLLDTTIEGAKNVIIYISGGNDLTMDQIDDAVELVKRVVDDNANIIFGANIDSKLDGKVDITLIATGLSDGEGNGRTEFNSKQALGMIIKPTKPVEVEGEDRGDDELPEAGDDDPDTPYFMHRLFGKKK